jgi:DNA-binding IclR family transcriptional regulator
MTRSLTPLPDGGYAEYAWMSITDVMRQVILRSAAAPGAPVSKAHTRTLLGLVRRDLIAVDSASGEYYITPRGVALVNWARERDLV